MATRQDPWRQALAHSQAVALPSSSNYSPKAEPPRSPINPAIMELLGELAMRFPKADNGDGDNLRIRVLAKDLSETMSPAALSAAIEEGRKVWRFLPTLAEIIEAAEPYREEQRFRARQAQLREEGRRLQPQPAIAGPPIDNSALLTEVRAKIEAGTAALLGHTETETPEPLTWRQMREAGQVVSPKLRALWAEKDAT